jgi:uncharacterized repeat protein (TIGR03803 family)
MRDVFARVSPIAAILALAGVAHGEGADAATLTTLYSFCSQASCADGELPYAGLISVSGKLYGTTAYGGAENDGTVFSIAPQRGETVLHSFGRPASDGEVPYAGLIKAGGELYGTTIGGGQQNSGTVFSITRQGHEKVLHSFGSAAGDGENPQAGLIDVAGTLYGTTSGGGTHDGRGTVFSITLQGHEKVLHSFGGVTGDGQYPYAGLINVGGTLYGTTYGGGAFESGTVFSITPEGAETVLYSFRTTAGDGYAPHAGLINVGGTLYGTTVFGGADGDGTVFSITRRGHAKVLYSFGSAAGDGEGPEAPLINVDGTLYGTTFSGGAYDGGTVFSVTLPGASSVLYSFDPYDSDGVGPYAGLINVDGTLYGTTVSGGANAEGTVFSFTP